MKSRLFRIAWSIAKNYSTFAEALRVAWQTIKLQWALCTELLVSFKYKKLDGTIREANGSNYNPPALRGSGRAKNYGVLTYFDLDVQDWRSAKIENIIW